MIYQAANLRGLILKGASWQSPGHPPRLVKQQGQASVQVIQRPIRQQIEGFRPPPAPAPGHLRSFSPLHRLKTGERSAGQQGHCAPFEPARVSLICRADCLLLADVQTWPWQDRKPAAQAVPPPLSAPKAGLRSTRTDPRSDGNDAVPSRKSDGIFSVLPAIFRANRIPGLSPCGAELIRLPKDYPYI